MEYEKAIGGFDMSGLIRALSGLIVGYGIGVAAGVALIWAFSTNTHDKSLEMVMTPAFVTGPIGALLGLIVGLVWRRTPISD